MNVRTGESLLSLPEEEEIETRLSTGTSDLSTTNARKTVNPFPFAGSPPVRYLEHRHAALVLALRPVLVWPRSRRSSSLLARVDQLQACARARARRTYPSSSRFERTHLERRRHAQRRVQAACRG